MLQKKHRIKNEKDILTIRAEGVWEGGRFYRLIIKETTPTAPLRVVIAVGTSQSKKATIRNRIRRRTWAALERSMGGIGGYDILLLPSINVKEAEFHDLVRELTFFIHALKGRHSPYKPLAKNPIP